MFQRSALRGPELGLGCAYNLARFLDRWPRRAARKGT